MSSKSSSSSRPPRQSSGASLLARGLTVTRGGLTVLAGIDLVVPPESRIGVVGPNGVGKSTLLQVLAGTLVPDAGKVTLAPPSATVGHLTQEPDRRPGETVRDLILRQTGVGAASAELDAATLELVDGTDAATHRYSEALDRWLALGAADLDARIGEVWSELGMAEALLGQGMVTLSGGQAARVSLAVILLSRFDILLLDEPTNDLDFDGIDRLEAFIDRAPAGMVIVSHDRAFLDRTIDAVLELDEHHRTGRLFNGGWSAYLQERATARRHAEEAYEQYSGTRQELADRARRQREWSKEGVRNAKKKATDGDKFIVHRRGQTSEKLAGKAKATERAIERLDVVEKPWEGWELRLELASTARAGDVVARLSGAVVERGGFRLGPIDLEIGWAERVAIVGPNGSGKSTLLGAVLGRIPLAEGSRWFGPGVVVGELDQARDRFGTAATLLDGFVAAAGDALGDEPVREARAVLAKFGLTAEHVARPIREVSPGERTRAALALLMATGTNCLVLDEPTNHLDLPAIEQLEQALGTWTGTLLLVTHDRRFLEAVGTDRSIELGAGLAG